MFVFLQPVSKARPSRRAQTNALLNIADGMEPKLRRRWVEAIRAIEAKIGGKRLLEALATGTPEEIIAALGLQDIGAQLGAFLDTVQETYRKGAVATVQQAADGIAGIKAVVRFDETNPRAVSYAQRYSYDLITRATDEIRNATRDSVLAGIAEGRNPRTMIRDLKQVIGLDARRAKALSNYRRMLQEGNPTASRRDIPARDASLIETTFEAGNRLPAARINELVEAYRDRLLRQRAETIARTESMRAVSNGNREAWKQVVEGSGIAADRFVRFWEPTRDDRTRDSHVEIPDLNPDGVGMDEPFLLPSGGTILYPHDPDAPPEETINCRCSISVRIVKDE